MAYNSKIEWTHHTFNGWHGCTKISPGCKHCYAESLSKRWGKDIWGPTAHRQITSDANWKKPYTWNRQAEAAGRMDRVFAFSMGDVFEDRRDLDEPRARFFRMVEETPNLLWLILSKRPENMHRLAPQRWAYGWPSNVCAMTSVENQEEADRRIPHLLTVPALYHGLSMEPLLSLVNISIYLPRPAWGVRGATMANQKYIDWVIVGGESGHGARPMSPGWVRSLRVQCKRSRVPFFFKQWGMYNEQGQKVGKKNAGRLLDGRTWDGLPTSPELPFVEAAQ